MADEEGFEHLFNAIIGEVVSRMKFTKEFRSRDWGSIYEQCICELHYVGGQILKMNGGIKMPFLLDEFGVQWVDVAKKQKKRILQKY